MTSLRAQTLFGFKWSTASQVVRQVLQVVTNIVLARLLAPQDFGVMGMAMIAVGFINMFKDLGTSAALIQNAAPSDRLKSTIFWLNLGFGVLATLGLWGLAYPISFFYGEVRLIPVLQALSLTFLISSLSIVHKAVLEKDLSFKAVAIVEASSSALGYATGIAMAARGFGAMSLAAQTLATITVATLMFWIYSPWRPKLEFSAAEARSISRFSANLVGFNVFNYFSRNVDNLLVGKYLGSQALGYYSLAYNIMLYPIMNISAVIARVLFPALARVQHDNERFRRAYLKVIVGIALVAFPLMTGLEAVAPEFVVAVFGEKWLPVAILLMILAPVGLSQSIGTTVGTVYQAKGRTDVMFRWGVFVSLCVVLAFIIGLHWGLYGIAAAYTATLVLTYPSFMIPFKLIDLPMKEFGRALWRPFTASIAMMVAVLGVKPWMPSTLPPIATLGLLVGFGVLVYAVCGWLLCRSQILLLREDLRPVA